MRTKAGYNYSKIRDSFKEVLTNSHGLIIGLGVEVYIIRNLRGYVETSYNFQKTHNKHQFRDYDNGRLTFGLVL